MSIDQPFEPSHLGRRGLRRASRRRLGWTALSFGLAVTLLASVITFGGYQVVDPEFYVKLRRLRTLRAEEPGRPLWLMLGTSKLADGFKPDSIATDKSAPIVFNFGRPGAKILWQYMALQRVLETGIEPDTVGIEIMGPTFSASVPLAWSEWNYARLLRHRDLELYRPFASNYRELRANWWRSRFSPDLLVRTLRDAWQDSHDAMFDRWGWRLTARRSVTPEYYAEKLEARREEYLAYWKDFAIGDDADRCLRAMLDLCRTRGIKAFLYEMPESTQFRAFYPPGARVLIEDYLRRVTTEYSVPWVNARDWIPDSGYSDGLHMILPGAEAFSLRFGNEVIGPFCRQWPDQGKTAALAGERPSDGP